MKVEVTCEVGALLNADVLEAEDNRIWPISPVVKALLPWDIDFKAIGTVFKLEFKVDTFMVALRAMVLTHDSHDRVLVGDKLRKVELLSLIHI